MPTPVTPFLLPASQRQLLEAGYDVSALLLDPAVLGVPIPIWEGDPRAAPFLAAIEAFEPPPPPRGTRWVLHFKGLRDGEFVAIWAREPAP